METVAPASVIEKLAVFKTGRVGAEEVSIISAIFWLAKALPSACEPPPTKIGAEIETVSDTPPMSHDSGLRRSSHHNFRRCFH